MAVRVPSFHNEDGTCADAGRLIGLDIGGTLVKLIFFEPLVRPSWCDGRITGAITSSTSYGFSGKRDENLAFKDTDQKGTFHCLYFTSERMAQAVEWIKDQGLGESIQRISTAGGGAHKYKELFQEALGITLEPVDELAVVVTGISWMVENVIEEVYWLDETRHYLEPTSLFPFLLVNVGSGVSIVRVDGPTTFKRVSGTALGGGTFCGLCHLTTGCEDFGEAMRLAAKGDASSVNLTVNDIYGGDYKLPTGGVLPASLTASFFAKAGRSKDNPPKSDILHALNLMISQNICQLAYLNSQIQGLERVVFTGNFLRHNRIAQETIAGQMKRVSLAQDNGREVKTLFLKHEGYFGAIGSLLIQLRPDDLRRSSRRTPSQRRPPKYRRPFCYISCICCGS